MSEPTTTGPGLQIPEHLLPSDGRFGCGPSKVRTEHVVRLADADLLLGTSHRKAPVKALVGRVRAGMRELFRLPDEYAVVLGNGGASAFWDIATFCLAENRALHLDCGAFSHKFAQITDAAPFLDESIVLRSENGDAPDPAAIPPSGADVLAWPQNETSTGVMLPVMRPTGSDDALVLIDATSGAGGLPIDVTQADAYYFAPQKCFGAESGLWLALLSPAALERAVELEASGRYVPSSLSLVAAIASSAKDETTNTPSVATLFLIAEQLEWMLANGGLDWCVARARQSSDHLYAWAAQAPLASAFVKDPKLRSLVVGTIELDPSIDASALAKTLRANGIVDVDPYRGVGGNQLRIAMFPSIEPADIQALTACIDWVIERSV
ncbi:MAG TPA: phosphoserine transaminase [Solirubrobacteraceae bacterium]|nr:phosphoserine transaminase [Solirubrobacteraceae bacterium]